MSLQISNLHVGVQKKEIIHGLDLEINKGEIHAIMGPNGSGKSTLANSLMGHPKYDVKEGTITLDGENITEAKPDERARRGLFLSMQYLPEIPGVTISNFLRTAVAAITGKKQQPVKFHRALKEKLSELGMDPEFATRYLNVGFSGGEKKRMEVLQLEMLQPTYAILDETDSGLDIDALKLVAEGIKRFACKNTGVLIITHYPRLLEMLQPTHVHIMKSGNIVESGGMELVQKVEEGGFEW